MPQREPSLPRFRNADSEYSYRRRLRVRDVLPAVALGMGAGLLVFYITRLLLQRTPLSLERSPRWRGRERDPERLANA